MQVYKKKEKEEKIKHVLLCFDQFILTIAFMFYVNIVLRQHRHLQLVFDTYKETKTNMHKGLVGCRSLFAIHYPSLIIH